MSIRRRRRFVGWSPRFALLVGGRAATWFVEIVFSLTSIGLQVHLLFLGDSIVRRDYQEPILATNITSRAVSKDKQNHPVCPKSVADNLKRSP